MTHKTQKIKKTHEKFSQILGRIVAVLFCFFAFSASAQITVTGGAQIHTVGETTITKSNSVGLLSKKNEGKIHITSDVTIINNDISGSYELAQHGNSNINQKKQSPKIAKNLASQKKDEDEVKKKIAEKKFAKIKAKHNFLQHRSKDSFNSVFFNEKILFSASTLDLKDILSARQEIFTFHHFFSEAVHFTLFHQKDIHIVSQTAFSVRPPPFLA